MFFCVVFVLFLSCFCFLFYQNFQIRNLWCNAQLWVKPVQIGRKELKAEITMKNLLIMQENESSGTISIYPSTMQPLCRLTHVDKLVTSNFQICFPAPYLSLHAKYSHCRTCPEAEQAPVSPIDQSNVIVFIRAYWPRDHTFDHVTFYCGWQKAFRSMQCPLSWANISVRKKHLKQYFSSMFWFEYVK